MYAFTHNCIFILYCMYFLVNYAVDNLFFNLIYGCRPSQTVVKKETEI